MVEIPITVNITIYGLAGRLPALVWVMGDHIARQVARGIAKGVIAEFLVEGINLHQGVEVEIMETRTAKRAQLPETDLGIDLLIRYTITNHEDIAIQNASGWKKIGLLVGKQWVKDLPQTVEAEIQRQMLLKLAEKLPSQVERIFAQYAIQADANMQVALP